MVRGIRGATTVLENSASAILEATEELLLAIKAANSFSPEDIVSIIFTMTPDLNAAFPAKAARKLGWEQTPLLCAAEIDHPTGLKRCIRVLLHISTKQDQARMKHVYLREARRLRPDLTSG